MTLTVEEQNKYTTMLMESIVIAITEFYMDKYRTADHLEKSVAFRKALNLKEQVQFAREKDDIVDRAAGVMACFSMLADNESSFEKTKAKTKALFLNSMKDDTDAEKGRPDSGTASVDSQGLAASHTGFGGESGSTDENSRIEIDDA